MKILFYDTQSYDRESFDRTKEQFPEIEVEYLKTGLAARTASLALLVLPVPEIWQSWDMM